MPLPILPASHALSPADLLRFYRRAELHWTRHLGEETVLDAGTAFTQPALPDVGNANRLLDATLPADVSPADAVADVEAHFAAAGTRCQSWVPGASQPAEAFAPLARHLVSLGYRRVTADVMYLGSSPASPPAGPALAAGGLQIIPARASFRHARALAEEEAHRGNSPRVVEQRAEAALLHLDDPHYDALVALHVGAGGEKIAVAKVGVLAVGEIGLIAELFVAESVRGQGIGRSMMGRAMEICARSLFRHVFVGVDSGNAAALSLFARFGFRKVGDAVSYRAPE